MPDTGQRREAAAVPIAPRYLCVCLSAPLSDVVLGRPHLWGCVRNPFLR